MVICSSSASVGTGSESHVATWPDRPVRSGPGSSRTVSIMAPDAPSMVAWWILVSWAIRPPSSPSITYSSHSGRLRSSGRPTMRDTVSASCSDVPGGATAWWRTWKSMSKSASSTQ